MTVFPEVSDGLGSLPLDGRLITQSRKENVDDVAFVSGMQGVICTTFMVEVRSQTTGKSSLLPVCGSVAVATLTDLFMLRETTPHWRVS